MTTRERPIIFSGQMVRAILEGRKTQTRRVIRPEPQESSATDYNLDGTIKEHRSYGWTWRRTSMAMGIDCPSDRLVNACPYGAPGNRLLVLETHWIGPHAWDGEQCTHRPEGDDQEWCYYREGFAHCHPSRWRPSIHMPRWASRLTLEITNVRVQRVQEIIEEDAMAEGYTHSSATCDVSADHARQWFARLWDSINAKRGFGWSVNPWVWALTFKVVQSTKTP